MYRYSTALRSLTQGKGAHSRDLSGYEPAPPDVTRKIIAEAEERKEEEHR
jgi:elongation factor G